MALQKSLFALVLVSSATAQAPIAMREANLNSRTYSIEARVEIAGTLTLPADKSKTTSVTINGKSKLAYEEKLLAPLADGTTRSLRVYRQAEFRRVIKDQAQESSIRPVVRRMVVLRSGTHEVPFSPDGPLTFGEIDLVRTDVYTPALAGLLPAQSVKVGDTWPAALSAVEEITDFERVEAGGLECRLTGTDGRVANVSFTGTVTGVNEDGPVRQQLDGQFTFSLDQEMLTSVNLTGIKFLLDGKGNTAGKVEGKFSLTRKLAGTVSEFSDEQLKGVSLEPSPTNTLLLYEGAVTNVRFTYPRRWRVSAEQGRQITLDGPNGSGLLITAEPLEKLPKVADFAREAEGMVAKQKGKVIRTEPPQKIRPFPVELDRFGMDVEMNQKPARMEFAVVRQQASGATLAATFAAGDAPALRPEFEQIAKSLQIVAASPAGVVPLPGK